jgi:hypothetical protein
MSNDNIKPGPTFTATVIPRMLSDRSVVYDVAIRSADGCIITLDAYDRKAANRLAEGLAVVVSAWSTEVASWKGF